ncbi:unnamed protein product [Cunninghamella blakesleeana]
MKFATLSAITLGAVSCYAGAIPRQVIGSQCNVAPNACCNQLQGYNQLDADLSSYVTNFFGGNVEKVLHGQFGIGCTAVGVMGAGGNQCNSQPVCCQNVDHDSLFGLNCSPFNVNG